MPSCSFLVRRLRSVALPVSATLFGAVLGASCTITTGPPKPASSPPATSTATAAPAATPVATAAATSSAPEPATSASASYNPCAAKKCGDRCNVCPPATPGCFETALVKMCHPDGQCKPATAVDCAKPGGS